MSRNTNYETANYPQSDDTTSSGGYGSSRNPFADSVQRGRAEDSSGGLIDQSVTGGPIGDEIQDAKQGRDASTREQYDKEASRDFGVEASQGLNPYGQNPNSRSEASDLLASKYTEARARDFEGGASAEDA